MDDSHHLPTRRSTLTRRRKVARRNLLIENTAGVYGDASPDKIDEDDADSAKFIVDLDVIN